MSTQRCGNTEKTDDSGAICNGYFAVWIKNANFAVDSVG